MTTPARLEGYHINAQEGLPKGIMGNGLQIETWESKAVVHKKLQTVRLIHDADVPHIQPLWDSVYEVVDVVIKRVPKDYKIN